MTIAYAQTSAHVRHDCRTWPETEQREWRRLCDPATPGRHALWARRRRAPWSRTRQYTAANVYTRYLAVVRAANLPAAITPEGVRTFVGEQQARCSARTIHGQVAMLKAVAELLYPEADWNWLDTTCRNLWAVAAGTPKRKSGQKHLYAARDLYAVGVQLIAEGVEAGDTGWPTTQKVRDGLWLVLGLMCPERPRALEGLRCAEVDLTARTLTIPAARMKTAEPSTRVLPGVIAEAVRLWLAVYRAAHVDAAEDHGSFWIAKGGGPVRHTTMATAMRTATKARLGVAVSPYRLRDAGATFIVEELPEHAPLAALLLRHRSEAMTREYTETARQLQAGRRLAEHLAAAHAETARNPGRRRARRRP